MEFDPQTRFVDADGARLGYQVVGGGGGDHLVMYQEINQHLDLFWTDDSVIEIGEKVLQAGLSLICLQERGLGLSDPVERKASIDEQAADLLAVLDAENVHRATLMGTTTLCLAVATVAALQPQRVQGLVLLAPSIVGPLTSDDAHGWTPARAADFVDGFRRCVARWGSGETMRMWDPGLCTPYNLRLTGMAERCSASSQMAEAVIEQALRLDGRTIYPQVQVPTRVLRWGHPGVPDEAVEAVAAAIPGAEYHPLPGAHLGDSIGQMYHPIFNHVIEVSRGAGERLDESDRVLASVLFTDIVDSTANLARLGDAAWKQLLEAHDQLLRRHVAAGGGRYVKNTGDGALCEFSSPAAAVDCATKLCVSATELGIEIRAGVHTGECERRGRDLAGMAVHVGARVCGAAGPGEVLASRTVHDLVAGSGLGFVSRGERELKGVPGTWELFSAGRGTGEQVTVAPGAARPRTPDKLVVEISRRAPGALRVMNRIGNAAQRRRFAGRA